MADPFDFGPGLVVPPRQRRPGEFLFGFVRERDRALIRCELRFYGEDSPWWEAQFLERGELLLSHSGFARKADAIACAHEMRPVIEKGEE
jgi:hypothetical protein